jgi:hypothetical protein
LDFIAERHALPRQAPVGEAAHMTIQDNLFQHAMLPEKNGSDKNA